VVAIESAVIHIEETMSENLTNWAYSYSGCDGGNPSSDIWLCGIEWGYERATEYDRKKYYEDELPEEIRSGCVELNASYDFFSKGSTDFPFNLAFAKMYAAIQNDYVSNYQNCTGEILKLNLSPIAFRQDKHELWNDSLIRATGFRTKSGFIEYINNLHRFLEIRNRYKPKLVVCVGNGYRTNFVNGFFGDEKIKLDWNRIKPEESNKNQNNRYIYHAKHDDTLLVVTPFSTSSNGLNSDSLLQKAGDKIRELLRKRDD